LDEEINIVLIITSRSVGEKISFREAAGELNRKNNRSLQRINPKKVLTMGDLNDVPYNKSVK
jgi:hypothetical protein